MALSAVLVLTVGRQAWSHGAQPINITKAMPVLRPSSSQTLFQSHNTIHKTMSLPNTFT